MSDAERPTLGEYIREQRLAQGKTLRQLGGSAISEGYISQMENGANPDISVSKLIALCGALNLPVGVVLKDVYGVETSETEDSYAAMIGKAVLDLPQPHRDNVIGFTYHLLLKQHAAEDQPAQT